MLFGVFVVLVVAVVALAAYSLGALLGNRPRKHAPPPAMMQQVIQLPVLPNPPVPPMRMARGTTPQPLGNPSNDESRPRGVISNREDATEPDVSPDARFSIRRSSKRIL